MVELNFCNVCFEKYKEMIEPNIQATILSLQMRPLTDWIEVESEITQIVMKQEGVFKGNIVVITLGKDEKTNTSMVDVEAFKKIKRWKIVNKINYLHKRGIIQDNTFQLLNKARETRNRLHDLICFSEEDYTLFHAALIVTNLIWSSTMFDQGEIGVQLKNNAEQLAKQWLEKQAK